MLLLYAGTHKFEKYYIIQLLGAAPEGAETGAKDRSYLNTYKLRSPYYVSSLIGAAMLFVQGEGDKIVPQDQIEGIVANLKKQGVPVAFILFPDEQHGLRIAKNIIRALEAEFYFYSQLLGFRPADKLDPIKIHNWPPGGLATE